MSFKNSIPVIEPERGRRLMLSLNDWVVKHELLIKLVPFTADVFVFTYPIYLVVLYMRGVGKRQTYYKEAALTIFFSSISAALVNMVIQYFGDKSRPEEAVENSAQLILSHLPTDPFPSDHAAVSAAVAMSTLLRGLKNKDKKFIYFSLFFWFACVIMSVSRVAVAIHRPTDILVGRAVGICVCLILFSGRIWRWLQKNVFRHLIALEKRIFKKVFGIEQD